ncbi:MAG: mechanosensitive ion channel [Ferruginibacter sp.]|nr:mechanosensitive ion channel [Ferruginibacter sp.]
MLVVFVLNFIGITTTSLLGIAGAAGLANHLDLQNTLTNFAGGVML